MVCAEKVGTFSRSFGSGLDDRIVAGDTWTRSILFAGKKTGLAVDFSGWIPSFDVVDSNGTLLETASVTPSPGDTTGIFTPTLTTTQTTGLLGKNTYRLAITSGADRHTLACGLFIVSGCP